MLGIYNPADAIIWHPPGFYVLCIGKSKGIRGIIISILAANEDCEYLRLMFFMGDFGAVSRNV